MKQASHLYEIAYSINPKAEICYSRIKKLQNRMKEKE